MHQLHEEIASLAEAKEEIVIPVTSAQEDALDMYVFDPAHDVDPAGPFPGRMKGRKLYVAKKNAKAALEWLNSASESALVDGDKVWSNVLTNVWRKLAKAHHR